MDVVVCDLGSRFLRAGKADPFPNDKEPWVVSCWAATFPSLLPAVALQPVA